MIVVQTTFPATPKGPAVPGLLVQPHNALALMLFGHGAGTPMHAPLMHQMSAALAARGVATFRYNYPYSQRLDVGYTEDLIDPLDVLLATTRAAMNSAQALSPNLPLFLGGRSMSSQVMSLALARQPWPHVRGLVLYVFPMRWRVLLQNTVTHLRQVPGPMLFVQGNRDPEFADLTELQPVIENLAPQSVRREPALSSPNGPGRRLRRTVSNHPSGTAPTPRSTLHVIPGADHSFNPPPQSNRTQQDAITEAATTTATWIRQQLQAPDNPPPTSFG